MSWHRSYGLLGRALLHVPDGAPTTDPMRLVLSRAGDGWVATGRYAEGAEVSTKVGAFIADALDGRAVVPPADDVAWVRE